MGPLQRRLLGLEEPPKVEIPKPVEPFEPEWLKRARTSKLPPKVFREGGGDVMAKLRSQSVEAERPWKNAGRAARLNALIAEQQGVVRLFTVRDQLGLHMRPSAHLARMAADFDANVIVENLTRGMPQKGQINAKYMPHLLALGARQGDQLRLRGTGTDAEAAVRALGGLIEHPGLTRIAQTNASLEKADPAMIRAAELFAKFTGRAGGGPVMSPWVRRALENNLPAKELSSGGKGLYIVGEVGKELFVPDRMRDLIPKKVMDQIPKAASGMQVIGQKPNSLFAPPEDGIIIPNRLMDQVPHRQDGGETLEAAFQQSKVDPYRKIREKAAAEFAARQGAAYMPQNMFAIPRTPPPGPSYTPSTATIASLGLTKPGAGVSTGPILTPAAEAASKMAAPFTGAAAAADKLRAAFEGFTPVVGSKKVASRGVATGGGGASASDEALFNGPAQYGNPEWRAARDRVLAQRAASRSPIERVSPRHRPQSQSTAPSRPAGMSNEEFLRTLDPEAQAFMGVSGGPRIPRGMQGASSRMGAPGRGGRTPEEREALARYRGTMADTMRESGAWQQVMGGRTPRGDIAQLSSMLFGGRGPMYALQNQARGQKRQLDTMTTAHPEALTGPMGLDAYVEKTAQLMGARGDERREIEKSLLAMRAQKNATGEVIEKFDELRATTLKLQPSTGSIVRNLGTIIGATTLYGFAMTMANKGMEVAGDVISKQVDALTNWKSTSTKVTSALAEQTMAASGNVTATISQAAATAGLSSGALDFVKAALQTTILVKAGALAEDKTQELMRASFGQQGAPAGLYGGTGGVLGSSLLASYMGGTKGFSENVQGLFAGNRPGAPDVAGNLSMGLQYFTNGDTRNLVNTEAKKQGNPLGVVGEIPGGVVDALRGFGPITGPVMDTLFPKTPSSNPNEGGVYNPLVGLDQNAINANAAGLEDLNSAAGRGASLTKNSASVHWRYAQNMAEEDAAVVTAIRAGDTYGATMARTSHIVMAVGEGIGKLAESSEQYKQAMTQSAMGKTIISPDVWAGLAQRQIEAQLQMNSLQAKRQQQLTIPWSVTMQLLQQPLITPGLAAFPGAAAGAPSGVAAGMSKGAASTAEGFLSDARKAQADVKAIAKQGYEAQLGNMRQQFPGGSSGGGNWATGVRFPTQQNDSTEVARFKELYATSQEASLSIQHTTEALAGIQLEADKQSWGNSIRLATRSLGDALGMAGKTGSVAATALGKMERASHFLEVQGTQLGLQLQQRSITTALAQAQFQAPGQTGEERFFAQKEAIAKAGIQQEQLNISTKEFNLSKQIWVENANRAATDAQRAIEVMVSSRDAEKATVAAQASIAASEQKLGVAVAGMQSLVGQADANWSTMTGAALSGISQFSGALDDGVTAIYKALGYSVSSKNGINTFTAGSGPSQYGPSTVTTTSPAQGGGRNDGGRATGMLGSFSTPTNVTFGEAGTETVAILRNPRAGSLGAEGGGGASGPVTVNINGPVVRNEQDIAELARCVAIEVEKSLARKGQMFGLRGAAV
jgi:phosphotransferase system HPr (HPr) family protein